MQIEVSDRLQFALEKAAAAAGMSVSGFASRLMEDQLNRDVQTAEQRSQAIDELIEHMKSATSSSGRGELRWREFIHDGHSR